MLTELATMPEVRTNTTRKVALVGFASSTIRQEWPEDVEIWTINCAWRYGFTRIDRLFEMHKVKQLTSYLGRETEWENQHWEWLQKVTDFPVYMIEHDERIPNSTPYPLTEVCADIFLNLTRGEKGNIYLTSSASFLMALAIHEGYNEINLAGFEMATGSEYTYQRDGMTYLIGVANGRGIRVNLADNSQIMKAKIYGFEAGQTVDKEEIKKHFDIYLEQRDTFLKKYEAGVKDNNAEVISTNFRAMFRANGALQSIDHLLSLSDGDFYGRQTLEAHLTNYKSQLGDAMGFYNKYNGLQDELEKRLKGKTNKKLEDIRKISQKQFRTMLLCEGAVQATENLISVCDLQEPNLSIREVTRFVEEKAK